MLLLVESETYLSVPVFIHFVCKFQDMVIDWKVDMCIVDVLEGDFACVYERHRMNGPRTMLEVTCPVSVILAKCSV